MAQERDVNYTVRPVGVMPKGGSGGGERTSTLDVGLKAVKDLVESGKAKAGEGSTSIIADYRTRTAASAAVNNLRHRHGKQDASGFTIEAHRIPEQTPERFGLYVQYDGSKVTPEGQELHVKEYKEWSAAQSAKFKEARIRRQEKAAAEAPKAAPAAAPAPRK